ncbi:MAG: ABC transporter ATP-binding protein [Patescibacteria group bacterium]
MNDKQNIAHYSSWQLVRDLLQLLRPHKGRFILTSLVRLLGDVVWLYPAFAFASLVTFLTQYRPGASLDPLWTILGFWLAAIVVRSASQYISKFFGYRLSEKLAIDSTLKTIQHMFRLDMIWHERENSGNKIKRIQNAADGLNEILRLWFNSLIEIAVNLIAINIIIASFDQKILIALIVFIVTYFFFSGIMVRKAGAASYQVNAQEEQVNGLLFEAINNIRTVKAMSMTKTLFAILVKGTDDLFEKLRIRIFWYQSRNAFLSFWANGFKVVMIVMIIYGMLNGRFELGFLILFNSYFSDLRMSIDELSMATQDFVSARLSVARMKDILNEPITIDDERGKSAFPKWRNIVLKNVSFSYGNHRVLNNISFEVQQGKSVGIVGLSGAGKSTLFKLLLKEREEFDGDICFDDTSIKKIRGRDYFEQVSVVLQDTEVFNFSLRDNITITNARRKTNDALLKKALKIAHLSELVGKLPQGLETIIGEKGVKLSGGERQRLGIARAIFKEPQILLLDEATSHLDLESEEKIHDSLHKFFENVTAIVIAHRLTTIKEMDNILVLESGKIIESGNFEKLTAERGRFFELWEKQKL